MRTEGVLNEEDLLEIEEEPEEVPRSEPDIDAAGCSGWTEGPETPDAEALVVVAGVDITMVLTAIDYRNKVLQARSATLDVEIGNIQSLIEDLKQLRKQWDAIHKGSGSGLLMKACMSAQDDHNVSQEDHFRNNVFYVLLDCVIGNMTNRSESIHALESMFGFLWKYLNMIEREVEENAKFFVAQHAGDVSSELVQEIMHLKAIHTSNLGEKPLNPIQLLNALAETSLKVGLSGQAVRPAGLRPDPWLAYGNPATDGYLIFMNEY
eukprot:Em0002g372a